MGYKTPVVAAYRLTHKSSGHCYVGSSADYKARLNKHRSDLFKKMHHNEKLQSAYTRWDDFQIDIFEASSISEARDIEQRLLDEYLGNRLCCNIGKSSLDPTLGVISLEVRRTNMRKCNESQIGRALSDNHKASISAGASREPRDDDTRLKISLSKSRRVSCGGKEYDSAQIAADALDLPVRTVRSRIYSETSAYRDWFFIEGQN